MMLTVNVLFAAALYVSVSMDRTPARRIRRKTRRCELKPQPVAVFMVVKNPPTEKNQIMMKDIEKVEVGKNITSPLY